MKYVSVIIIVVIFFCGGALLYYVLNPPQEKHQPIGKYNDRPMSEKIDQDANAGILPMAFGSELPPIGQWVSCDDKRYSIGAHGLCDFPEGEVGLSPNKNIASPESIVIPITNGNVVSVTVFSNGTIVFDK